LGRKFLTGEILEPQESESVDAHTRDLVGGMAKRRVGQSLSNLSTDMKDKYLSIWPVIYKNREEGREVVLATESN